MGVFDVETLVIGAGAVGLATARALSMSGREVMVIERHDLIGSETSARNSEVIHAGIYYPKDSLKAHTCVEGKELLYRFCAEHGVAHERIGKLIVASDKGQVTELEGIRAKAAANGVEDLRVLSRADVASLEPELNSEGALLSPSTGIIDSHGYMLALQGELEAHGGQVVLNTDVVALAVLPGGGFAVTVAAEGEGGEPYVLTCHELILSAGHDAPRLGAELSGAKAPKSYLAKGSYFKLAGRAPFSQLVYPVPEPGGLGVHLTFDLQHQARFGPDVEWVDHVDYRVDPARGEKFYAAIRRYWPGLPDNSLVPDYSGIRPKISGPGEAAADFHVDNFSNHGIAGFVALYGIESPGLTASLSLAQTVLARL